MIKLNIQVGAIYGCWKVLSEPEKRNGSKLNYCLCECIYCKRVQKYIRCSDLAHCRVKCLCQRKQRSDIGKIMPIKTQSFAVWCLENGKDDILSRWDYELNNCAPEQISYKSASKMYFKCEKNKHESAGVRLYSIVQNGANCNCEKCRLEIDSFGAWCLSNDPSILNLWDYDLNEYSPFEVLKMSGKKAYFKCPRGLHNSSLKTINKITSRGYVPRCTFCNSLGQFILDTYGEHGLDMFWDYEKNVKNPFEVQCSADSYKVFIKCIENNEHGSYEMTPYNFKKGERCWRCKSENITSALQNKVKKYIQSTYNYSILNEYQCTLTAISPKTNYILPYDNQVIISEDINLIVEVMGEQHYKITGFVILSAEKHGITPNDELREIQWRDEYKKQYALCNGFFYMAIPYWAEADDLYKQLIDDKIHEILLITQQND